MADQQQFFLKWNDFQSNMVTSFRHLRDEKSFTDVTLACEGQTCKAHKMVLSACSPYFKSLLEEHPSPHPVVFLGDISFVELTSILDFMYHGEVTIGNSRMASFMETAEKLQIRGLAENPSKHPIIILKDVAYSHLQAILEFMYAGEVNVSQEQLPAFLKTADRLKVKGLAESSTGGGLRE